MPKGACQSMCVFFPDKEKICEKASLLYHCRYEGQAEVAIENMFVYCSYIELLAQSFQDQKTNKKPHLAAREVGFFSPTQ